MNAFFASIQQLMTAVVRNELWLSKKGWLFIRQSWDEKEFDCNTKLAGV